MTVGTVFLTTSRAAKCNRVSVHHMYISPQSALDQPLTNLVRLGGNTAGTHLKRGENRCCAHAENNGTIENKTITPCPAM
jgi:hypothetical protein